MKLSDYILQKNMTVAAFAQLIGVTPKAVDHWIGGVRYPRPVQMQKIVEATAGAVMPNDFMPSADADVEAAE
jgi:DNA-binding transcriptional regulator YdaS (Cro superfamily)